MAQGPSRCEEGRHPDARRVGEIGSRHSAFSIRHSAFGVSRLKIYLACTVRGDRGAIAGLRTLVAALEADGHEVLTRHLLDDNVDTAESRLTEREVYERDIEWLEACDLLVADASGSSFGVGFEVGYVLARSDDSGQRVLLLYRADRQPFISRLIGGNSHPRCTTIPYTTASELATTVPNHLKAPGPRP